MVTTETVFCVKMLSVETFKDWLLTEMESRGWNQNELAKRAGVSHGTISNILNDNKGVGRRSLSAIARALKIPPEVVFRAAGLLPPDREADPAEQELIHLYRLLPPDKQQQMLEYARFLDSQVEKSRGKK